MKARLTFLLAAFALTLFPLQSAPLRPAAAAPDQCLSYCAIVRCIGEQICGLYTNASGQRVCGCHDPRPRS